MALGLAVVAAGAGAQEATPARSPVAVATLTVAEVAVRVEQVTAVLRNLEAAAAPSPEVVAIEEKLASEGIAFRDALGEARAALAAHPDLDQLRELERVWAERRKRMEAWSATLAERGRALEELIARARALDAEWRKVVVSLGDAPSVLRERVDELLSEIAATLRRLEQRRDAEVVGGSRAAQLTTEAGEVLDDIGRAQGARLSRLFVPDAPPAWRLLAPERRARPLGEELRESMAVQFADLRAWLDDRRELIPIAIVLLLAVLATTFALRRRARLAAGRGEPRGAAALLEHPVSVAIVVWVFLTPLPYRGASPLARGAMSLVLTAALLRLLPQLLPRERRWPLYALASFVVIDGVRGLIEPLAVLERALFTLECVGALGLLHYLASVVGAAAEASPISRAVRTGLRFVFLATVVSLLANAFGYLSLARFLGDGTVRSAYVTALVYIFARIAEETLVALLHARHFVALRVVGRRLPAIERAARRVLALAVVWGWAVIVLRILDLLDIVRSALSAVLTAELAFGEFALSLGDVLVFAFTVWGAFFLSRLVRALLDDEVLPRMHLSRGVPYAISTIGGYAVLLFGFFAALAAAGVPFGRLAIVVGGLGVGVGFGLQNIVNNFVSGTVLLFERPIQIGDMIQMEQLLGRVKRIGLRSSTIESLEGAEVIVPNANLISSQLVNWTLSDRRRRIDLPVGVAYGSDPERVLALLVDVARRHRNVLPEPPPSALFLGFGASSLDFQLRAWTEEYQDFLRVRSDLAVEVNRAFAEAGISIPFPQQDVHVRSVAPEVFDLVKPAAEAEGPEPRLGAEGRGRR